MKNHVNTIHQIEKQNIVMQSCSHAQKELCLINEIRFVTKKKKKKSHAQKELPGGINLSWILHLDDLGRFNRLVLS